MANNQRIRATVPTIQFLKNRGARSIILISHLDRPNGKIVSSLSLSPVADELAGLLDESVAFLDDCVGEKVESFCSKLVDGSIVLLENLRFHLEEEGCVKLDNGTKKKAKEEDIVAFRSALTSLGDVYVNDAFGAIHRAHSSIVGISLDPRVAGLLVEKELEYFSKVLSSPEKIHLAILGGAKVSDKIQLIKNLLPKVKKLAIGGGMAFTFLKALYNMDIGKSLFDAAGAETAKSIVEEAKRLGVELILPTDFVTGNALSESASIGMTTVDLGIPKDMMGLDFGPKSIAALVSVITQSKSVLWNGPIGVFEISHFAKGTRAIVDAMVEATKKGAITIVGGGDSGAAVVKWNAEEKLSHVSTGGGASLELLEGKVLPGIAALTDKPNHE